MAFFVSCLILLIFPIAIVQGRMLSLNTNTSSDLISDGVNQRVENQPPLVAQNTALRLPSTCDHQYGFLPCVENIWGYVFMILVYQGLLIHGGMMIGSGCAVLANIIGSVENLNDTTAKIGDFLLTVLMSLPSMILMIASGVFSSKEVAQSMVSVGVAIYAGITVFTLTVQWAVCVMCGKKYLQGNEICSNIEEPASRWFHFSVKKTLDLLKDNAAITIDEKTQYTAGIMLLSLIPYVIVQLDTVFKTTYQIVTLAALIVSSLSLLAYFIYQIMDPWSIQKGQLDYLKHELRTDFLKHLQRHGEFVDDRGELNTDIIRKLYADVDTDSDNCVTEAEVKKLVEDLMSGNIKVSEKFAVSEIMKTFNFDNDMNITENEFIQGCEKWIGEANLQSEHSDGSSSNIVLEILSLLKENKLKNHQERARIMSKILKHAENHILKAEKLVTPDGKPNVDQIRNLFRKYDSDGSKGISTSELKELLNNVNFGETQVTYENVVKDLFQDFDKNGDNEINELEFSEGIQKWVLKAVGASNTLDKTKSIEKYHDIVWQHRVYGRWDLFKSVFKIILGIAIMTFLGGPFMVGILQLSYPMSIPSFCISFIVVPLFTCGIATYRTIQAPTQQKATMAFQEIYGKVIMNNVAGMTALLAIVYMKGLAFDFSAEVLTTLVVCAIIGAFALFRKTYPGWTSILAIILYPLSLGLFWLVQFVWSWK